jgi:hypothetical protein
LALSFILLKDSAEKAREQKMAADFHSQWTLAHPCAKNALAIVNVGSGGPTEGMFSAMASHNTDLDGNELARYFYRQVSKC